MPARTLGAMPPIQHRFRRGVVGRKRTRQQFLAILPPFTSRAVR